MLSDIKLAYNGVVMRKKSVETVQYCNVFKLRVTILVQSCSRNELK